MSQDKYVAYVSTYTMAKEDNYGIKIYDVDMKNGRLSEKNQVEITNSSYITISHNEKYLYSITDFGVEAYKILPGGDLEVINEGSINGMRGCQPTMRINCFLWAGIMTERSRCCVCGRTAVSERLQTRFITRDSAVLRNGISDPT